MIGINEDVKLIEANYEPKYVRCRIALGQLKNLVQYFHWKNHRKNTKEVSLGDIASHNFKQINRQLDELQLGQRKV